MRRLALPLAFAVPFSASALSQHAQVASLTSSGASSQAAAADLSRDGRWLAHTASIDDPVLGDTNSLQDVWLRNLASGARVRVSVDEAGQPWTDLHAGAFQPVEDSYFGGVSLSDAGERVAFVTLPNAFPPSWISQVRVFDRASGVSQLVSSTPGGAPGNYGSDAPVVSGDGRHVVFVSGASDLVANDTNNAPDLFARDLTTQTTTRIALAVPTTGFSGPSHDVSYDGRYVVHSRFVAGVGTELAEVDRDSDGNGVFDEPGTLDTRTLAAPGTSEILALPSRSLDGRFVAFVRRAVFGSSTLMRLDRDTDSDGVLDEAGATSLIPIAQYSSPLYESSSSDPYRPSISSSGARIAWYSAGAGPFFSESRQVYTWDAATGAISLQSYSEPTGECSFGSVGPFGPSLSGDGQRMVACMSTTNVAAGDPVGYDALLLRYDVEPVGIARYCVGAPNSVGAGASLSWSGIPSRSLNQFTISVSGCPPGASGLFFYGPTTTFMAFGNGWRCVSGSIFRLGAQTTSGSGTAAQQVRFDLPPADVGPGALLPGTGWNFQFYYRNPAAGGAGFNASNALHVPIYP